MVSDNQHRKITGYPDLSQDEINTMNEVKRVEAEAARLLGKITTLTARSNLPGDKIADTLRWLDIAREQLESGFMFAAKAVAQPTEGLGRNRHG